MDDDLEGQGLEGETPEEPSRDLPENVRKQISDLTRKFKLHRERAEKAESLALEGKFSPEVQELIPAELPFEKKWELAEKLQAKLSVRPESQTEQQGGQTSGEVEKPPEPPSDAERNLAAVTKGTSVTASSTDRISLDEYQRMVTDPAEHARAIQLRTAGLVDTG